MVLSRDPDTICRLSAEKATDSTSLECPMKRRVVLPEWISHSRSVPSQLPDRANCPSEEITTSDTLFFLFFFGYFPLGIKNQNIGGGEDSYLQVNKSQYKEGGEAHK